MSVLDAQNKVNAITQKIIGKKQTANNTIAKLNNVVPPSPIELTSLSSTSGGVDMSQILASNESIEEALANGVIEMFEYNGKVFYVPKTGRSLKDYEEYVQAEGLYQNTGNPYLYGSCDQIAKIYVFDMLGHKKYMHKADHSNWNSYASSVRVGDAHYLYSDDELNQCMYDQLLSGNQFTLRVDAGKGHSIAVVGFASDVTGPDDFFDTSKILIMNPTTGKISTMKEAGLKPEIKYRGVGDTPFLINTVNETTRAEAASVSGKNAMNKRYF